jgi:hypothetical protein
MRMALIFDVKITQQQVLQQQKNNRGINNSYRINSYNSSVSSNSFFSRSVRFLQDTTVKTTTAKLKNTFSS